MTSDTLLGPLAALALALVFLGLFYSGKILPRNVVPREEAEEWKKLATAGADLLDKAVDRTAAIIEAARPAPELIQRLDRIEQALDHLRGDRQ